MGKVRCGISATLPGTKRCACARHPANALEDEVKNDERHSRNLPRLSCYPPLPTRLPQNQLTLSQEKQCLEEERHAARHAI
eukprot:6490479-Amphidinium_carterae.2